MTGQEPSFIAERLVEFGVTELFYVTHSDNLDSIFQRGVLPKNRLAPGSYHDISLAPVQDRRDEIWVLVDESKKGTPEGVRHTHDMVPLFFNPRNPMTSSLRDMSAELALLVIDPRTLCDGHHLLAFTDGNLASSRTRSYCDFQHLGRVPWKVLRPGYWKDHEDGPRKRGAEFLVWPSIEVEAIQRLDVPSPDLRRRAMTQVAGRLGPHQIIVEPYWFRWGAPKSDQS